MPAKEIKSLKTCFRILSLFSRSTPKLDAEEISRLIGAPRSSVYRYLHNLVQDSIIEYDQTLQKYSLGLKILELGATAYNQLDLRKVAAPLISELAGITKETVYLAALVNEKAICIDRVESDFPVRLSITRGDSFPLHASATAKVLMAYLPEEQRKKIIRKGLRRFTDHTITDPLKLEENLKEIGELGYADSDQELDVGARAVSAPVFDIYGRVVACLSIAGPVHRFTDEKALEYRDLVIEYSRRVSSKLGYKFP